MQKKPRPQCDDRDAITVSLMTAHIAQIHPRNSILAGEDGEEGRYATSGRMSAIDKDASEM